MNGKIEGEEESEEEIRIKTKRKDNKDNKWNTEKEKKMIRK